MPKADASLHDSLCLHRTNLMHFPPAIEWNNPINANFSDTCTVVVVTNQGQLRSLGGFLALATPVVLCFETLPSLCN